VEEERFDLMADTYEFCALRLTEFCSANEKQTVHYLHLLHATTLWALNLFIQGSIVFVVWGASNDLERPWSDEVWEQSFGMTLKSAGEELLDAIRSGSKLDFDNSAKLLQKCDEQTGISTDLIYYIMIFIWLTNQMKEFKRVRDWWKMLWEVSPMTLERTTIVDTEKKVVQAMPIWLKVVLFIVVPFAKFVVFVPTTFVGFKFLALQTVAFAVVMKAVALQLVLSIDEMLIQSLALRTATKSISATKILHEKNDDNCGIKYWYDGVGALIYLIGICFFTFLGLEVYYSSLMFFRRSCRSYAAFALSTSSPTLNATKLFAEFLT